MYLQETKMFAHTFRANDNNEETIYYINGKRTADLCENHKDTLLSLLHGDYSHVQTLKSLIATISIALERMKKAAFYLPS